MDETMELALAVAEAERAIDPVEVDRQLRDATADECRAVFWSLRICAANYLVGTAICVGRAIETAGYGDKAAESLAKAWDVSRATIFRLAKIYREIVRPRLDAQGPDATFVLDESTFYLVAVEQAPRVEREPLELLAIAEDRRTQSPGYSVRDFKDEIESMAGDGGDEGSTSSEAPKVDRILGKLADLDDGSMTDWVAWALSRPDSRKKIQRVEDALTAVDLAVRLVRERAA